MLDTIDSSRLGLAYSRFLDPTRVLLTGHSHQAWPDVAERGLLECFEDAARLVDDKWEAAARVAHALREFVAMRIGAEADEIALGQNTHELVTRFLSALDLRARPHLVTTTGEFHSMRRQLRRLEEAGVRVSWVEAHPVATLAQRLNDAIEPATAAVLTSSVLFENSSVVPHLDELAREAQRRELPLLVDAYHAFGVVPFSVAELGAQTFIVAGGYKYAQWGEGCCFMRAPKDRPMRPLVTGWFADYAGLEAGARSGLLGYGSTPAEAFAGSTYDPASHYRARAVIRFFESENLNLARLRRRSLEQTQRLFEWLEGYALETPRAAEARGGFVSLRLPAASDVARELRSRGVYVDSRGELLRLGPAPYTTDDELERAVQTLRAIAPVR